MLKKRRLYIWGEINDSLGREFVQKMNYLASKNKEPICICIHSPGGDLDSYGAMLDEIKAAQGADIVIKTVCMGIAYSAGAAILAMGNKGSRFVRPHSSVMLHPCSYSLETDYEDNQEKVIDFLKNTSDSFNHMLAAACGMNGPKYKKFKKDIAHGLWLTAKEAVNYGVADKILEGSVEDLINAKARNK